ncbi:metal-dependent hydrolase [Priestia aryabhattai]|uniref:metal-dependent hydrolase n=1 Tax=Priestia aryabhattai TaxID=412384 RepID=UPI0008DDF817|nr:metal-dependent hydrolase [Priestia aryabhattai]MBX9969901.1 metal-dependent hydrolase [Priestia aryabhattai]MDH3112272.1 metal-dependent hydrolase [Priestia aryabhattai]MDH3128810.1 metal-dependent hydrolase [Priestia aryabhattai]MDH3130976.1 metal-dependent hydrolase [Priestia aryabhattai]MED4151445.1 metal-dependent hydrolase [Priestia aryabhattai]
MHVSYHGHSIIKIETKGKTILIDPFITGNELTDLNAEEVKADVILLTHGHNDHVGDTVEIAKRSGALVVAVAELATYLSWQGLNVHPMSIGGAYTFDFGTVKLTQAFHGSSYTENNEKIIYTGMPAGLLLTIEGKTIYHAGDTALFSDLKLIGRHKPDLAFLPIGDNFTMGPEDAAIAAEWVQAKLVVPIHYNTFSVIKQDPHQFVESLSGIEGKVLKAGEGLDL